MLDKPKNRRTKEFKKLFDALPLRVRTVAENRFREYFLKDPSHPLLGRHDLFDVGDAPASSFAVWMARKYRAVAYFAERDNCYVWYWCGSHADYDQRYRKGR